MKKILFVLFAILLLISCNKSSKPATPDDCLKAAWSFVEAGECDSAQNAYLSYLQGNNEIVPDLEDAIQKCRFDAMMQELEEAAAEQDPNSISRIDIAPEQINQLFKEDDNTETSDSN